MLTDKPKVYLSSGQNQSCYIKTNHFFKLNQAKVVDITIGTKSKANKDLKGWNSSKLITTYNRTYKPEWVPYLFESPFTSLGDQLYLSL